MAIRRRKPRPVTAPKEHPNAAVVPEGARPCPICGVPMTTSRRGDDAIDVCEEHGVWLDRFELERMCLRRARAAGRRVQRARKEGQLAGFFWGVLI
ncbi:MAG: zf-TFIIB domain-containing protein [Planctomycetota bacterium]